MEPSCSTYSMESVESSALPNGGEWAGGERNGEGLERVGSAVG